jgi:hypothetical protein
MRHPSRRPRPSAQLPTGMRRPSRRPRPSHGPARSGFPQACSHGFPTGPRAASFPTGPQAASFPTGPQATSRERQAYLWAWGPIADARVIGDARACLFGLRLPVRGGSEAEGIEVATTRARRVVRRVDGLREASPTPRRPDGNRTAGATRETRVAARDPRSCGRCVNRRSLCGRVRCELRFRLQIAWFVA